MSEAIESIPLSLSQASGVPFYRQIVDQVADLVRSGALAADAQLPSVRALASQLLVSLITVRRAYADLENAGLIVRRQGHGTYVADQVESASHEQSLTDVRDAISAAIDRARRLGVNGNELRRLIDEVLEKDGKNE
jgi:GntR family transcriptional regulator